MDRVDVEGAVEVLSDREVSMFIDGLRDDFHEYLRAHLPQAVTHPWMNDWFEQSGGANQR